MHRIFAAAILHPDRDAKELRISMDDILRIYNLQDSIRCADIYQGIENFRKCIAEHFSPEFEDAEVPFTHLNAKGQRVTGFIDYLLKGRNGHVIIDHKVFPGKKSEWHSTALSYSGQLAAYREATGQSEAETWIHFSTTGALLRVEF